MSEPLELPDKLLFRIGEVSALLGVRPHVLRYWETEFPALRPDKSRTNQRLYQRRDVEILAEVKRLLYEEGFTIAGARKRMGRFPRPALPSAVAKAAAAQPPGPESGLQSGIGARIRGAVSAKGAQPAAEADPEIAGRYRDLERALETERAAHRAFRDRMRGELEAIRALTQAVHEGDDDRDGA